MSAPEALTTVDSTSKPPRRDSTPSSPHPAHDSTKPPRASMRHPRPSIQLDDHNPPLDIDAVRDAAALAAGPPSLEYTLHTRKRSIAFFWGLILFDSIVMPISLYFSLWYTRHKTGLSPNTVFSIVTAAIGGISIFEYALRFWRLFKKGSTCRVIGARRAYLDWFHWCFTFMWVVIMCELIIGTVFTNPPIRVLSMPLASALFAFGTEMLIVDIMRWLKIRTPFRMSSQPKGSILRPAIYPFIEDVVAVDGSGGVEYRKRLSVRYESSHVFRTMLHRLTLFWGIGAEAMAVATTVLVFTLERDAAYAVGWSIPFIWAAVWVLATIWYVKKMLRLETETWGIDEDKV